MAKRILPTEKKSAKKETDPGFDKAMHQALDDVLSLYDRYRNRPKSLETSLWHLTVGFLTHAGVAARRILDRKPVKQRGTR